MYCCRVGLLKYFCQGIKDALLLSLSKNSTHSPAGVNPETQPERGDNPPAKTGVRGSSSGKLKKLFITI